MVLRKVKNGLQLLGQLIDKAQRIVMASEQNVNIITLDNVEVQVMENGRQKAGSRAERKNRDDMVPSHKVDGQKLLVEQETQG